MADAPMAVVETGRFLRDVKPMMSDSEREEVVAFVGANPAAGEIIPETGGRQEYRQTLVVVVVRHSCATTFAAAR